MEQTPLKQLPLGRAWTVTRKKFLHGNYRVEIQDFLPRLSGDLTSITIDKVSRKFATEELFGLPDADGYAVARKRNCEDDPRQCILLHREHDGIWRLAGMIDSWGLYVAETFRGRGLGGLLAYAGMALANEDTTDTALYSTSGYAAFAAAHRISVMAALAAGAAIPAPVLADYPEFIPNNLTAHSL